MMGGLKGLAGGGLYVFSKWRVLLARATRSKSITDRNSVEYHSEELFLVLGIIAGDLLS